MKIKRIIYIILGIIVTIVFFAFLKFKVAGEFFKTVRAQTPPPASHHFLFSNSRIRKVKIRIEWTERGIPKHVEYTALIWRL